MTSSYMWQQLEALDSFSTNNEAHDFICLIVHLPKNRVVFFDGTLRHRVPFQDCLSSLPDDNEVVSMRLHDVFPTHDQVCVILHLVLLHLVLFLCLSFLLGIAFLCSTWLNVLLRLTTKTLT